MDARRCSSVSTSVRYANVSAAVTLSSQGRSFLHKRTCTAPSTVMYSGHTVHEANTERECHIYTFHKQYMGAIFSGNHLHYAMFWRAALVPLSGLSVSEMFTVVTTRITVFLDVTLCSSVCRYQHFRRNLVSSYQTAWCHIPEDSYLQDQWLQSNWRDRGSP
jgi:hypothetical protein